MEDIFKIRLTSEQSRVVQLVLFRNGYKWNDGSDKCLYLEYDHICLALRGNGTMVMSCASIFSKDDNDSDYITFDDFRRKYDIKGLRRDKLDKLGSTSLISWEE